jgi:hypothetical protein
MKTILLILIGKRKQAAVQVQKILTAWGCMIKTRLGIHAGVLEDCSEKGLLILELVGERSKMEELARKVSLIKDVAAQLVDLDLLAANKIEKKSTSKKKVKSSQ